MFETRRRRDRQEDNALYWDEQRRAQMGFMNNVLLGLALAGFVFMPDVLANGDVRRDFLSLNLAVYGLGGLLVSVLFGLACGASRLMDFRAEATLARPTV